MVAAQQMEGHGFEDQQRQAEEDLSRQEQALQQLEEEADTKQRLMAARVAAVEAERAVLKKSLQELAASGVTEADALLKAVPKVPLLGSVADRHAALEARREAVRRREQALGQGNRERDSLMEALARMRASFEETRLRMGHAAQRHEHREVRKARMATPPPPPQHAPPPARMPPPPPVESRRTAVRTRLDCEVGLETDTNFFSGFAWDISSGGLFVTSFEPMHVGQEVELGFSLPDGSRVEAMASVRWVRDHDGSDVSVLPGIGLQFTRISDVSRAAVERFVKTREPMFMPD